MSRQQGAAAAPGHGGEPSHESDRAGAPLRFDHARRIEAAREALSRSGAAGMALVPGPNLRYFTGVSVEGSERLLALLVPVAAGPVLVTPGFERERVEREAGVELEVAAWSDGEDPFRLAGRALGSGAWLLDPVAPFWIAERFRELGSPMGSAAAVCSTSRRSKEPAEQEALGRAQRLTRRVFEGIRAELEAGLVEREVADAIVSSFRRAGADGWALVQFGEGSAVPHGEPGDRPLAPESAVLLDLGAVVDGYHADLTRSWWHGEKPAAGYEDAHGAVREAHDRAAAAATAGARTGELDRTAREHLAARGFDRWFTHRLGHGVGLEIHEEPFLLPGSEVALAPGDVFTIEPGVYLPGRFGIRHEDLWVAREDGASRV